SLVMVLLVIAFDVLQSASVISTMFTVAGYTYGPLLGLYAFGLYTKRTIRDKYVPVICIVAPILTYIISYNSMDWLGGYVFGYEVLLLNSFITFTGLMALSKGKIGELELVKR
ncbi:MAG: sodium:solute symporter, partial [Pontibacter sp.]|nr:sodium:solute symporter [Pontibacter sp.]